MSHLSFVYLDDGLGSQPDKISAHAASVIQRRDLQASGLLCNEGKSHWTPKQIGGWLGLIINIISMQFSLPPKKVDKLHALLSTVISNGYCSYRFLAKIVGVVLSCASAVGPISRLLSQMYFTIATRSAWDSLVHFTPALLEELRFWYTNIGCFNGCFNAFGRSLPLVQLCFPMLVMWVLAGTPQLSMVHP